MKLFLPLLTFFLAFIISPACKTSVQKKALPSRDFSYEPLEKDDLLSRSIDDLQKSIDVYKESKDYQDPKTEAEEDFNKMVDAVDELDKDEAEFLAEKGEFGNAEKRAEQVEEQINIDSEEIEDSQAADEESRSIKKSGIFMIYLSTLGVLAVGTGFKKAYVNLKNPRDIPSLPAEVKNQLEDVVEVGKQLGNPELDSLKNKARISYLAAAGLPVAFLLMGSLLVAKEQPSESMVTAAQVLLFTSGGLGTAAGVSLAAVAANPEWSRKAADVILNKATSTIVKVSSGQAPDNQPIKAGSSSDLSTNNSLDNKSLNQIRKLSLGFGIIIAALGVGQLFAGADLNLAATKESPKARLLRSVSIFFKRMQKIEASLNRSE